MSTRVRVWANGPKVQYSNSHILNTKQIQHNTNGQINTGCTTFTIKEVPTQNFTDTKEDRQTR